jgi:peptidoglycan/LPS O-acetylase OafA/YrhL
MAVPSQIEAGPTATLAGRIAGLLPRWPTSRKAYPLGYLPALDGVRGLMAVGTLTAHTSLQQFGGASVYMDVFYAMSGYLITSLLLVDYGKHGKINLKKFYIRRFMRLYPALAVVVAGVVALCLLFSTELRARLVEAGVAFFYLTDYWLGLGFSRGYYFPHTWSLAVEEQFYLLWPLTLIVLLRRWGLTWKTATAVFVLAAVFWAWRIGLTVIGVPTRWLFFCFDTRADSLLLGCGLGIVLKLIDFADYPRIAKLLALSLVPIFLLELTFGFVVDPRLRWYYMVSPLFGAIPGIICVGGLVQPKRTFMHRVYEHPIPVYCGRICYGLYLYHFPIFQLVRQWAPPAHVHMVVLLVGWPLAFVAATASYFLVERHFMRARPV